MKNTKTNGLAALATVTALALPGCATLGRERELVNEGLHQRWKESMDLSSQPGVDRESKNFAELRTKAMVYAVLMMDYDGYARSSEEATENRTKYVNVVANALGHDRTPEGLCHGYNALVERANQLEPELSKKSPTFKQLKGEFNYCHRGQR